jgi:hypothetical protein
MVLSTGVDSLHDIDFLVILCYNISCYLALFIVFLQIYDGGKSYEENVILSDVSHSGLLSGMGQSEGVED